MIACWEAAGFVESLRGVVRLSENLSCKVGLDDLEKRIAVLFNLQPGDIQRRGRQNEFLSARALFCYFAFRELHHPGAKVGVMLRMGVSSVSRAIRRGEELVASRPELVEWWIKE